MRGFASTSTTSLSGVKVRLREQCVHRQASKQREWYQYCLGHRHKWLIEYRQIGLLSGRQAGLVLFGASHKGMTYSNASASRRVSRSLAGLRTEPPDAIPVI